MGVGNHHVYYDDTPMKCYIKFFNFQKKKCSSYFCSNDISLVHVITALLRSFLTSTHNQGFAKKERMNTPVNLSFTK